MSDLVPPASLNSSSILNPPSFHRSAVQQLQAFVSTAAVDSAAQHQQPIPAIPATAVGEPRQPSRSHIWPTLGDQAPSNIIFLGKDEFSAAVRAVRDKIKAKFPRRGHKSRYFDSDSDSDSDANRWSSPASVESYYPFLRLLDDLDVSLTAPNSVACLNHMLRSMPQAQLQEAIRIACPRICDVVEKDLLMDDVPSEAFSNPYVLTKKSSENWVLTLKSTAIVFHLLWNQLGKQNQQSYQELKSRCFAEVADQSMDNLLNFACSFSNARWPAYRAIYILPVFDALVEVLDYIKGLPFSRSENIKKRVTDINHNIVNRMHVIIKEIPKDARISMESDIHPATDYLLKALKFVQAVPGSGDDTNDLLDSWVSKLEEITGRAFGKRKDQQYIFILNNAWFVSQTGSNTTMSFYTEEVKNRVDLLIQHYLDTYLDEFWIQPLKYSSADEFTRKFEAICSDRILKVLPGLRKKLVEMIQGLIFRFTQNGLVRGRSSFHSLLKKKRKSLTTAEIVNMVNGRFER